MSYKLTICVLAKPDSTLCIDEVMENLLLQTAGSEVEVLLLNCGLKEAESRSWKNTPRSNWRYIRCAEDATADELLQKCVHIAEGDYCWIFNGYDVLANGAVQRVLAELRNGYTLVLLNSILCDTWLRPLRRECALKESIGDQIFNFRNESDMVAYLEHAASLMAAFSYQCGVVFSTESIRLKIRETHDFPDGAAFIVAVFALLREEAGTSLSYVQRALIYNRLTLITEQSGKLRESIASDFSRYSYIAGKELAGWPKAASALIHYALRGSYPWAWSELCAGANGWGSFREELAGIIDFEDYRAASEIDAQSAAQGYSFYEIGSVSRLQVHDRRQAAVFMDGEVDDLTIVSIRHEKVRIHRVLEMSCVDFLLVRPSKKAVFNLIAVFVDGSGTVYYPATVECWHNKVLSMLSGWVQKELECLGHNKLVLDEGQTALPLNIRELQQGRAIPCLSDYLTIVHHIKRYRFSADHLLPGRVLDCACGVGYGASIMLRNEDVTAYIGVDLDEDVLIFSEWNVQDPRASFQQGDISELNIGKFENIVSLETLEHVKDPDGFLADLATNLRPDGRLILSVPAERWAGTHLNPYHVTNWTYRRFSSLVERHFEECVIYRQKLSLLGPDTFSASEIVSGPHYADEDEDFIAVLGRPRTRNKRRIFVRRRYALGDVVLTTPIIRALRNQHPDAVILLATDVAQVYQNNPNVDVVGNMQLEPRSTDILIDLDGCYERLRSRHIVHAYTATAGVRIGDWRSEVFPSDSDRAVVIAALRQRGWANTRISYLIGVHMAASSPDRVWPAGYWKEWFARALDTEAIAVVVVGSDRDFDVDTLKLTREQSARVLSLVGQTSVQTSAAALSLCDLVVAPDSGMTHLANAVGVRTLVLFGMADPDTRLPLDGGGTGIWSPVECRGCLKRLGPEAGPRCRYGAAFCMEAVTVDAVWSATEAELSSAQADSWRARAGLPSCRRGGRVSAMIEGSSPGHKSCSRVRGNGMPEFLPAARMADPRPVFSYRQWCNIFGLHESDGQVMAERMMQQWHHQPAIHMIAMLRRGEGAHLAATLDSLSTQLYAGWGLTVLAEEPCPDPRFAQIQNVEWCESGGDRVAALNAIVGESESDWVGLLRPGDRLAQQALFACVDRLQGMSGARLLYTDWDRLDEAGGRCDPRFERDVDVDWLRTGECLGGLWLIRRDALLELGGFADRGPEEARDLALRVFERFGTDAFGHVDEVLCHRPASSRAAEEGADTGSHRAVLSAHLRRMGESGEILDGLAPRALRVRYPVQREPVVSVIVDTVDDLRVLERFIDTLRETTEYRNLELVVVDCGSRDEDSEEYFDTLRANGAVVASAPEGAGRAEAWNAGACAARGEFLIFADRRAGFVQKDWLETLLGHAQRKGVGIVAPRIVGADGTVVHSALVLGFDGPARDAFRGLSALDPGYGGRALTEQGCSAVPPACLLVSRACFEEVGGFDAERFSSDWFSVDFCLRSEAAGHHAIWTPYALVGWQAHEPARETGDPEQEAAVYERWLPRLARDPFYHRNLDLSGAVFRPRMEATARWNPVFHERPRILGVPADTFGCGEYRILAPLNALDDAARAHCGLLAPQEGSPRMPSVTELARLAPDTLLLQSALYDVHLEALHRYYRFNQVFRVFDMEDLKTNVPEKNSRRPFLFRNIKARTRQALSLCDRLIVTTAPLAEAYRGLIGDIRVVPVYLARERWGSVAAARNEGSRPRVGWAGGQQHEGDLEILLPIVQATAGEVDWVFLGMCPEVLRPYVKEVHDMVPFAEYPARLGSLALDLAVAPLEEHPFNVAKTNLRLLEYGILGWPVVCTEIEPYRGAPVMRVSNDSVRWIEAIRERVNDLDAARAEGARLREWVLGGWMLEDHLDEWLEALSPSEGTGAVAVGQPQRIADGRGN